MKRSAPVGQGDDAGLAVDQPENLVGQDAHLELAVVQQAIEALEALAGARRTLALQQRLRPRTCPRTPDGIPGGLGGLYVERVEVGIADDADRAGDGVQLLADQFQQRGGEVAGDAVVAARVPKPLGQKGAVEPLAAGGETTDIASISLSATDSCSCLRADRWLR